LRIIAKALALIFKEAVGQARLLNNQLRLYFLAFGKKRDYVEKRLSFIGDVMGKTYFFKLGSFKGCLNIPRQNRYLHFVFKESL